MNLFGVRNIHEPSATEIIEYSVTEWLKWGLLEGGAFQNVASGVMRESPRPGIPARTLYQTPRADLVWESGVPFSTPPIAMSGVYVNGLFVPFGSGCTPNYPAGTVTFSPALSGNASVVANYSARTVRVFNPRSCPWYYTIQWNSYDSAQAGSGLWSPDGRMRVQLPAIFAQAVPRVRRFVGVELGSRQRYHRQDVQFDILAESSADRDRLHDALVGQWEGRWDGIDLLRVITDGRQPLTPAGTINPSGLGYQDASTTYPWTQLRVINVDSIHVAADEAPRLFRSVIRWEVECNLPH